MNERACQGPLILSAFALGAGNTTKLANGLSFFLAFGLGFGWPLALLPLIALPLQRRLVGWLTRHHTLLNRASGILLIAIGVFGALTELLPQYLPTENVTLMLETWALYWIAVAILVAGVIFYSYRQASEKPNH